MTVDLVERGGIPLCPPTKGGGCGLVLSLTADRYLPTAPLYQSSISLPVMKTTPLNWRMYSQIML